MARTTIPFQDRLTILKNSLLSYAHTYEDYPATKAIYDNAHDDVAAATDYAGLMSVYKYFINTYKTNTDSAYKKIIELMRPFMIEQMYTGSVTRVTDWLIVDGLMYILLKNISHITRLGSLTLRIYTSNGSMDISAVDNEQIDKVINMVMTLEEGGKVDNIVYSQSYIPHTLIETR